MRFCKTSKKIDQSTNRCDEFISAKRCAKKMATIHDQLLCLKNGIEDIVSNWDAAQPVSKKAEKNVTVDACEKESSRCEQHPESGVRRSGTVNYFNRIRMVLVKLTEENKAALNRHENLGKLCLADALYEASSSRHTEEACKLQLLQHSAELLHPDANYWMGFHFQRGYRLEKNLDLAVNHFRIASKRQHILSIIALMEHYHEENHKENVLKYIEMACSINLQWQYWIQCAQFGIAYSFNSNHLEQPVIGASQSERIFQASICHFFGFGGPKSKQEAIDALHALDS